MSVLTRPPIVTSGLVLHLDAANRKSYPGSGTTWFDISGNRNNLNLTGSYSYDQVNTAMYFVSSSNPNISYTGNIDLTNTNKVSVDFYCRIPTYFTGSLGQIIFEVSNNFNFSDVGFLVSYGDNSNSDTVGRASVELPLRGNTGYNISHFDKSLVNDSRWHHWCCIFDKSRNNPETFLYIDGVFKVSTIASTYTSNNTNNFGNVPLYVGGRYTGVAPATFQLSSYRIYNRTLSAQEILQNYNAQKARFGLP